MISGVLEILRFTAKRRCRGSTFAKGKGVGERPTPLLNIVPGGHERDTKPAHVYLEHEPRRLFFDSCSHQLFEEVNDGGMTQTAHWHFAHPNNISE